jgi:23S rRNA (uracil1939-C5)-methyltransferase
VSDLVEPPCPFVAEGCGGCDWQHLSPAAQRSQKADLVADELARVAGIHLAVAPGPDLPTEGHRTTVRGLATGGRFAFRQRSSHDLVAVDPCLIVHPLLAELIADARLPDGEVVLRAGARTGERLVVVGGDPDEVLVPDGVRVVSAAALEAGKRAWYHEEVAGRTWRISARSFFQARPDGAEALVDAVGAALEGADGEGFADLYGGVGLFAGTVGAGRRGRRTLVEQNPSSVADARINVLPEGVKVVRADVGRWKMARAAAVVADPPRAGLGKAGVRAVVTTRAERVALVSCDPASLARDARLLTEAGYALRAAPLVDLFPHTSHVEVVSRFDRIEPTSSSDEELGAEPLVP